MSTKVNNTKTLDQIKTPDEIKEILSQNKTGIDPDIVLKAADKELNSGDRSKVDVTSKGNLFKAMTLFEFENGALMATAIPEPYQTFGVDMMRRLQEEFNCQTVSEKATAELAAVNYIRTLEAQNRITRYVALGTITENGVKFLAIR